MLDPNRGSGFLVEQAQKGYLVRAFQDLFADPSPTGYRVIAAKIEVPLVHGGSHIGEVQVRHSGMESAHRATTELNIKMREITRVFNDVPLSDSAAAELHDLEQQRRDILDRAAEHFGLTALEGSDSSDSGAAEAPGPIGVMPPALEEAWQKTRAAVGGKGLMAFQAPAANRAIEHLNPAEAAVLLDDLRRALPWERIKVPENLLDLPPDIFRLLNRSPDLRR
ncbi:hypothetical protein ACOJBM_00625 [Rhizobium beringeri]